MSKDNQRLLLILLFLLILIGIFNNPEKKNITPIQPQLAKKNLNLISSENNLKFDKIHNFNQNSEITKSLNYLTEESEKNDINSPIFKQENQIPKINQDLKPSCLDTQLLPDLLNYSFSKLPPSSFNQQQCFKKKVDSCPLSNYQQCTNNYPLKDYTTYDICNCNGFSTTNLCPYKLTNQNKNVDITLKCPLYFNQVPYNLILP